jgi:hypothetical protein
MIFDVSEFRKQFYMTAESAGLKIIPDDKCCQLLAWLHICGGENEQVVFNEKLNAALLYAQRRLNLLGGERPNAELLPALRNYIKSVSCRNNPPEWVIALEKEYGIQPRRGKWD